MPRSLNVNLVALALTCLLSVAHGQPTTDFLKGRQLRLITGHQVGSDYDVGARLLESQSYVYAQAPRDGTVIGDAKGDAGGASCSSQVLFVPKRHGGTRGHTGMLISVPIRNADDSKVRSPQ